MRLSHLIVAVSLGYVVACNSAADPVPTSQLALGEATPCAETVALVKPNLPASELTDVLGTLDGGFAATRWSPGSVWVVGHVDRFDASGHPLWSQGWAYNKPLELLQLPSGHFVIGGTRPSNNDIDAGKCWLARIDADGEEVWSDLNGDTNFHAYRRLAAAPSDGTLALRQYWSGASVTLDRFDASGALLWSRPPTYNCCGPTPSGFTGKHIEGLAATADGTALVATRDSGVHYLARVEADGTKAWEFPLGISAVVGNILEVRLSGDGSLVALAQRPAAALGAVILRLDMDGTVLGIHVVGEEWPGVPASLAVHGDGSLSVAGTSTSPGGQADNGWLMRLDANATPSWQRFFGLDPFDEDFGAHAILGDGRLVCGGDSESGGLGAHWLVTVPDLDPASCEDAAPECVTDSECVDGDPCNGAESCDLGSCVSGLPPDCASLDGPCSYGACIAEAGGCVAVSLPPGTSCSDGAKCTVDDTCDVDGFCAGADVACDDENPCTADSCDPSTGWCTYQPDAALASCPQGCQHWELDGWHEGEAVDLVADADGGFIVGRTMLSEEAQGFVALTRYDRVGSVLWHWKAGGWYWDTGDTPVAEVATGLVPLPGAQLALIGHELWGYGGKLRVFDAGGDTVWSLLEPGSVESRFLAVVATDEGAAVAGLLGELARVRLVLEGGVPAWDWYSGIVSGSLSACAEAIVEHPASGTLVVAGTVATPEGNRAWLGRLSPSGDELSLMVLGALGAIDQVVDVLEDGDGVVILARRSGPGDVSAATLVALELDGTVLWSHSRGGAARPTVPTELRRTPGGHLSVVGWVIPPATPGLRDGWHLLLRADGSHPVGARLGDPDVDEVLVTHDFLSTGGVAFGGTRLGIGPGCFAKPGCEYVWLRVTCPAEP